MLIKLVCQCGTKYSFDVEPVNGRMPFTVACPTCNTDGTPAANAILAQTFPQQAAQQPQFTVLSSSEPAAATAPAVAGVPSVPAGKPRLRMAGAHQTVAPPSEATAAAPAGEKCNRHLDKLAAAHCTVCKKPICPECMSMFGYLCSVNCRYQAEQQGIKVPKYKFQKRSVEARQFRKGAMITGAVLVLVFGLIGAWYWYDDVGTHPKLAYTINPGASEVHSQFLGDGKVLLVSKDRAWVQDLKTQKDVWSTDLKDAPRPRPTPPPVAQPTQAAAAAPRGVTTMQRARNVSAALASRSGAAAPRTAARQPARPLARAVAAAPAATTSADDSASASDDDSESMSDYSGFSDYGRPQVLTNADNIWICFNTRLKCLDQKSGEVKNTIWVEGRLVNLTRNDDNLLLVSAPTPTQRLLTRIDMASANTTTNLVYIPRPAKKVLKRGELPTNVLPTARYLLHQELDDRKLYRPQVIQTSSEFFASGDNLLEMRVRLAEIKLGSVQTMKTPGKSVVNGNLTASSNTKAVAEEIFNDLKRSETGGARETDESTYAVTLHRWNGKESVEWTNNVVGAPVFFPFKTVDVLVATKHMIAFDKQTKKLFEANLSYEVPEPDSSTDTSNTKPGVELDGVLYFYDKGLLAAYELPSGNVRWRLPTVGITCIQADSKGMLYINTSSAAPEDIQYVDQIKMDKVDAIILKVDPKSGKTLWKAVNRGQQCFFTGKYLFTTSSFLGGLGLGNALRDALGMAADGPSYFHIYRLNPDNGDLIWDYGKNKDGAPYQADFQNNKILLNYGEEIRLMKFLQLF